MQDKYARIEKLARFAESGFFSEMEVANEFLLMASECEDTGQVVELYQRLPEGLQAAVHGRLAQLRESQFEWRPLVLGEGYSENQLSQLSKQLLNIYQALVVK